MCDSFVFHGKTIRIVCSKCFRRRGCEVKTCAVLMMEAGNIADVGRVRLWNIDAFDRGRYRYMQRNLLGP